MISLGANGGHENGPQWPALIALIRVNGGYFDFVDANGFSLHWV